MDIDECYINNGGCQMRCENFFGGFNCLCSAGYTLVVRNYFIDLNQIESKHQFFIILAVLPLSV